MGYLVASLLCAILVSLLIIRRGYVCNSIEMVTPALCCLTLSAYFATLSLGWPGLLADVVFISLACLGVYYSPVAALTTRYLPGND